MTRIRSYQKRNTGGYGVIKKEIQGDTERRERKTERTTKRQKMKDRKKDRMRETESRMDGTKDRRHEGRRKDIKRR